MVLFCFFHPQILLLQMVLVYSAAFVINNIMGYVFKKKNNMGYIFLFSLIFALTILQTFTIFVSKYISFLVCSFRLIDAIF